MCDSRNLNFPPKPFNNLFKFYESQHNILAVLRLRDPIKMEKIAKALLKAAKIFRIAPAGDNNVVQPLKLCLGGSTTTTSASSSQSNNQRKRHRQDSDSSYSSICTFIYLSIYFLLLLQSNSDKMNIKSSIMNSWSNFTLYQFDSNYSRISFIEGFVWLLATIFHAGQIYVKYLFLYESI